MITFLVVAFGIAAIIAIHEASHMLVSKLFGVKVLKFSLGFGPVLLSKEFRGTSYELRLLPLGGFVQCAGEDPESNEPNGFFSLPWYKRALIALAGPVANLLLGFLLVWAILTYPHGWPLLAGAHKAFDICSFVIVNSVKWIFNRPTPIAAQSHVSDLSGPIMVTKILANSLAQSIPEFIFALAMISLSIGLFNLFPFPALDGGHLFLYLLEGLRGKKFSTQIYVIWSYIGYFLLFTLLLFTCFLDTVKIFH